MPERKYGKSAPASPRRVLVALWMNGVFGQDVVEGIHEWLRENRKSWRVQFADSPDLYSQSLRWMLAQKSIDGVITRYNDASLARLATASGVPVVRLGPDIGIYDQNPPSCEPLLDAVQIDFAALATACVDHFLSRAGFRSGGFVENSFDHGWSRHRGDAVMAEFARRGIPASRFFHYGEPSRPYTDTPPDFDGLRAWIQSLEKPAAVVAANDATAVDVLRICEADGIAVPRDVAVLGMDDNPVFCQHAEPNLSSVHFNGRYAGRLSAEILSAMMDGLPPPPHRRYGAAFIVRRASTGAVSTAGALVQKALDFIDANSCRGADVADVARHCGVSRSLLQLRFRELHGVSVARAIHDRRIAEARRLLAETDLPAESVAAASGWGGVGALRRASIAASGLSPGAWRAALRKVARGAALA